MTPYSETATHPRERGALKVNGTASKIIAVVRIGLPQFFPQCKAVFAAGLPVSLQIMDVMIKLTDRKSIPRHR